MVDILYNALARELNGAHTQAGEYDKIEGVELLDKIINIDQSPIGRTPRSNPGTYTGHVRRNSLFVRRAARKQDARL